MATLSEIDRGKQKNRFDLLEIEAEYSWPNLTTFSVLIFIMKMFSVLCRQDFRNPKYQEENDGNQFFKNECKTCSY